MKTFLSTTLLPLGALVLGGVIGLAFGMIQNAALLRNKRRQQAGDLNSGWAVMPGSMRRVAFLMMALVIVQVACPFFFHNDIIQWLVSTGVVAGYGWTMLDQVRMRSSHQS